MSDWIAQSSTVLDSIVFGNALRDYILALIIFLGLFLGLSVFKRVLVVHLERITKKTATDIDDFIVGLISQVGWPTFSVVSLYSSSCTLVLSDPVRKFIGHVLIFVLTVRVILLLQSIVQFGLTKVLLRRTNPDEPSSKALVGSVVWLAKWALWVIGIVFILDNLGVNISSLVAGIGIGGIAVAMASQAVLGDAFSALCIYLDKPFETGDFIIVDDCMGTVENIGLKTTRIRSLSGEQLVFANADLTKSRVKNYKRMQTRRIVFKIGIIYQTPLEKVKKVPDIIKAVLNKAQVNTDRVHFQSFGDSALIFETVYFVLSADYNVYMDKQQTINLDIMQEFQREGIEFAYPTQTLYMKSET